MNLFHGMTRCMMSGLVMLQTEARRQKNHDDIFEFLA